jgi:esterase
MKLNFYSWPEAHPHPENPTLLFLHGMGGTGKLWRPVAATLENSFQILALDQRAHGESQLPKEEQNSAQFTPMDYARDVSETLDSLHTPPVWVIGHSMGVRTACALAHLFPHQVRGLVLIDLGFSGPAGGGMGEPLRRFLASLPFSFPDRQSARQYLETHAPDPSIGLYLLAGMVPVDPGSPSAAVKFPFHAPSLVRTIEASPLFPARPWLHALASDQKLPILSLRGARSQVWTHEEYETEKAFFADCPSIQFQEVPNTGHGLPFEARTLFCQILKDWITSQGPTPSI